jgi:hypothetical protein
MRVFRIGSKKKRVVLVVALTVAATAIGVAIAAWTTGGSGSGAAQAGSAVSMTISAGTPSSSLYPGGSADVAATISNPNPYPVHVSSIALGAVAASGGCNTGSITVTSPQTNGVSGWDVPARVGAVNGSLNVDLANAIAMDNTATDACQGATFTVALTATGASS